MITTFEHALASFRYQLRMSGIDLPEPPAERHAIEAAFRNAVTPVFSTGPVDLAAQWPVAQLVRELRELGHQDAADLVVERLLKKDPESA